MRLCCARQWARVIHMGKPHLAVGGTIDRSARSAVVMAMPAYRVEDLAPFTLRSRHTIWPHPVEQQQMHSHLTSVISTSRADAT